MGGEMSEKCKNCKNQIILSRRADEARRQLSEGSRCDTCLWSKFTDNYEPRTPSTLAFLKTITPEAKIED